MSPLTRRYFIYLSLVVACSFLGLSLQAGLPARTAQAQALAVTTAPPPAPPVHLSLESYEGRHVDAVEVQGAYAFAATTQALLVLDVTDKSQPRQVARLELASTYLDTYLDIEGSYLYFSSGDQGLFVIDISDPTAPHVVGSSDMPSDDVDAVGNRAYVISEEQLHIIDLSNPAEPTPLGLYEASGAADVKVAGDYAYLLLNRSETERRVEVINIADGARPTLVGSYQTGYYVFTNLDVAGNFVYVSTTRRYGYEYPLMVIDVSNPTSPTLVSDDTLFHMAHDVVVQGDYAYVLGPELSVVDVRDPTNPTTVGKTGSLCYAIGCHLDLAVQDGYAYVAHSDGLSIIALDPPADPSFVSRYPPTISALDVDVEGAYAYLVGFDWPAFQVLDLSNPARPTVVGTALEGQNQWGEHVVVQGRYAYVTGGIGLQVVDVMTPTAPQRVGHTDAITVASSIAVSGSYLYAGSDDSGFHVLDVSDPVSPTEVGHLPTPSRMGEVAIEGETVYVAAGSNGLRIIDVSTPTSPDEIGTFRPTRGDGSPADVTGIVVSGSHAYINDETTLYVVDVSNPEAPRQRGYFQMGFSSSPDVAVEGSHAYILMGGNLLVIDVASPVDLREVGRFTFQGGVFGRMVVEGDRVYIASRDEGLLILRATTLPHSVWLPLAQRE